jgi:hypothetical protein
MSRLRRRTLLGALASGPVAGWALARTALTYELAVRPRRALLGDRVTATLSCQASEAAEAFTFEDASLMVQMRRLPADPDPAQFFPNHQQAKQGEVQVHLAPVSRKRLRRGERLHRELDLVAIYPRLALDTGDFELSYTLGRDGQSFPASPAKVTVESGPAAVPGLMALLADQDGGVRARAAGLLHRMTAHTEGYAATGEAGARAGAIDRWRRWWEATGRKLPWNFRCAGASFGAQPAAAPTSRRGLALGGLAYQRRPLGPAEVAAMAGVLAQWQRSPSGGAATLRGRTWIADQLFSYPGEDVVLAPSDEVVAPLEMALSKLAEVAGTTSPEGTGADIILATVGRLPDARFVASLSAVESAASRAPAWRRIGLVAGGWLDLLDPSRTPTGS